jgi:hypothetical protein
MSANAPLDPAKRRQLISQIRELPARLSAAVAGLSPEALTTPYLAGEWTVAQNVHHVADAHISAISRIKLILTEDHPTLKTYDQDDWANLPDSTTADLRASLLILEGLHARWATLLESLTEEQFQRVGVHPERGDLTIDRLVTIYSGHGAAHLDQIARTLAARG